MPEINERTRLGTEYSVLSTHQPAARPVALADDDLRVQTWCMQHLERLTLDAPAELKAGIVALLRMLFQEADARDAASGRLWCALSLRQLSRKLLCTKKTVEAWWDAAEDRHLVIDCPDPQHAQRLRRRPQWDVIAELAQAAARTGAIPGMPLFVETAGTVATPVVSTGVVTTPAPPDPSPQLGYSLPQFGDSDVLFSSNSGGGVRGGSPLKGGTPLTPTARRETGVVTTPVTAPVDTTRPTQLLLDFARESAASDQLLHQKVDRIEKAQIETRSILQRILDAVMGAKKTAKKKKHDAEPSGGPIPMFEADEESCATKAMRLRIEETRELRFGPLLDSLSRRELEEIDAAILTDDFSRTFARRNPDARGLRQKRLVEVERRSEL